MDALSADNDASLREEMKETKELHSAVLPIQGTETWEALRTMLESLESLKVETITQILTEFRALNIIFDQCAQKEKERLFQKVIPFIASMALQVHALLPQSPPLLPKQNYGTVNLSQEQCFCLLSLAFFDALPAQMGEMTGKLSLQYWLKSQPAKLKCILNYFSRMQQRAEADPGNWGNKIVSFTRKVSGRMGEEISKEILCNSTKPLLNLSVTQRGVIEDAHGALQADFANEYIGGGVLHRGCVQEEIRFTINPECLVSILLFDCMEQNESIVIVGAERFCNYKGYGRSFDFDGDYVDETETDQVGRINTQIVAFDALPVFGDAHTQFGEPWLLRDLQKLFAALEYDENLDGPRADDTAQIKSFATGNWGCGAFRGDPQLKSLMQWAMASFTNREVLYFPFNDERVAQLGEIVALLKERNTTVGQLFSLIFSFGGTANSGDQLFNFVQQNMVSGNNSSG